MTPRSITRLESVDCRRGASTDPPTIEEFKKNERRLSQNAPSTGDA
jgi:hypothetical protein